MISANLKGYVPLQVAVTAPANGQTVLPSVTATAMVTGGTPPYTVTLYTNSAVAWSTNNAATNLFSIYLGTLAVGTYTACAKVTDSAAPAVTYTSATNTFTVVAEDPNGFKFECSSKFPGACAAPAATNHYTVAVNASHPRTFGRITMKGGGFARRPTGAYAAPGTVVTVTVPPALVGQGYKIRVGCHSWDHSEMQKDPMKRLDRVSTLYDIVSTDTLVANPLGGSLYIEVPYLASNGVVNVTFTGAARSPLCQVTSFHATTPSEWLTERTQPGPWADFQTDKYMMQVPRSWIYALADPFTILTNWDTGVDVANDLMGFPRIPGKPTLYQQIDIDLRGNALFPGYPFNNETYEPNYNYGGNYTKHWILSGPQNVYSRKPTPVFLSGPNPQPIVSPEEQIENSSLYFEKSNKTWFLFTNHIGLDGGEYTDAVWVYWSKELDKWDAKNKAVVLDGKNCTWSKRCIGMPSVVRVGQRLAIFYDAPGDDSASHMERDLGLGWLELPLSPPKQ